MKNLLLAAFVALVSLGCGHLRPDPNASVLLSNYPSLEIHTPDGARQGAAVLPVVIGQAYPALSFVAYYQGKYWIESERCNIHESREYTGSPEVSIPLPTKVEQSCVITITTSPEYPTESSSGLHISSMRGHIFLAATDGETWTGDVLKVTGKWSRHLRVLLPGSKLARVIASGCGINWDQTYSFNGGILDVDLATMSNQKEGTHCILTGYVQTNEYADLRFDFYIAQYLSVVGTSNGGLTFAPLPAPYLSEANSKIYVGADPTVSIVSIGSQYTLGYANVFKNFSGVLRAITVAGRLVICERRAENDWRCQQ